MTCSGLASRIAFAVVIIVFGMPVFWASSSHQVLGQSRAERNTDSEHYPVLVTAETRANQQALADLEGQAVAPALFAGADGDLPPVLDFLLRPHTGEQLTGASSCRLRTAVPAGSAVTTAVAPWNGSTTASTTALASSVTLSGVRPRCRPASDWRWR